MGSKLLWLTTIVSVLTLFAADPGSSGVLAQVYPMASCPPGWEWNKNSFGQDPCLIASLLESACRGYPAYDVPPLGFGQSYLPPQSTIAFDLRCDCDTVMYSLYEACTTCQGGTVQSWTHWAAQCEMIYVTLYPYDIPPGTAIPRWAFFNITSLPNRTYSDTVAIAVGRDPEATPTPPPTLTLTVGSSTTLPSTYSKSRPSSDTTQDPAHTGKGSINISQTGAIVGGVVGSVVPLIILAVVVGLILHHRRRSMDQPHIQEIPGYYGGQPPSPTPTTRTTLPMIQDRVRTPEYYWRQPASPTFSTDSTTIRSPSVFPSTHGHYDQGRHDGTPAV